jgi:thiamine-monophosphate kinase
LRRDDARVPHGARRSSGSLTYRSEDELVAQLREIVEAQPANRRLLNRIGDDAALWQPSRSHRAVITTDALIESRHFRRDTMSFHDIGWRAMAANLSDLAAMGSRPVLATVALGIPDGLNAPDLAELYRGMLAVGKRYACAIAGGDTTRASELVISITAVGEVRPSNVKGRAGALPGDVLAVTGPLGASRAGLDLADNPYMLAPYLAQAALRAHRTPEPRVNEGRWLAASTNVHAMMDVSDGLSTDLPRMCAASRCAAVIEDVPVADCAREVAHARGEDPQAYALAGGEDFELLIAVNVRAFRHLSERFTKRFGRSLHRVGHVRKGSGVTIVRGGAEEALESTGWDPFR